MKNAKYIFKSCDKIYLIKMCIIVLERHNAMTQGVYESRNHYR